MSFSYMCPRCNKRERENIDGDFEMYCSTCNDNLAESYRDQQEFQHYHRDQD